MPGLLLCLYTIGNCEISGFFKLKLEFSGAIHSLQSSFYAIAMWHQHRPHCEFRHAQGKA